MASGRKSQHDNNLNGFNFQHYTLMYLIDQLQQNTEVKNFRIGSAMAEFGALDDVVYEVELENGTVSTHAVQAKHSKKLIDEMYYRYKSDTYAFKYFKSYLDIKKRIPLEQIGELIIWTTMDIKPNMKDNFVDVLISGSMIDGLFENFKGAVIKRFKNKDEGNDSYPEFADDFLELLHPLNVLAKQFANVLNKKDVWQSDRAAKDYHVVMVNEVIDCTGNKSSFRQAFVDGDQDKLQPETMEFRKYFESAMSQIFIDGKYGQFSMAKLNDDDYRTYIELKVDANFGLPNSLNAKWPRSEILADESDIRKFFERFRFYAKLPTVNSLEEIIKGKLVDDFDQFSDLIKNATNQDMVSKEQINHMSTLICLRRSMDVGPYEDLMFRGTDVLNSEVETFLKSEEPLLVINKTKNVDCTVSKLISIFESLSVEKRYLVIKASNFDSKLEKIFPLLQDDKLLNLTLECIIVSFIDNGQIEKIKTALPSNKIKFILVGDGLEEGLEDTLNIDLLDDDNKQIIKNRAISLSAFQNSTVGEIFSNDLFQMNNLDLVLGLYCSSSSLEIRSKEPGVCDFFRSERLVYKNEGSQNHIPFVTTVISDHAGTGKTMEMLKCVLEERNKYQDHLVVYLDCIDIVKQLTENIQAMICKILAPNDAKKSALIKSLFQMGKVILFLDNNDKLEASSNSKLLMETTQVNIKKLYIATRPHREEEVLAFFPQSIVCSLKPFGADDQLDYVKILWGWCSENDESKRHQIHEKAKDLIDWYSLIATLFEKPLYIHIVATKNRDLDSGSFLSHGSIIKEFIDYELNHHFDPSNHFQQDVVSKEMLSYHGTLAFKLFTDAPEAEKKELCLKDQMCGFVKVEPSPGFIHDTFEEYFLVRHFLTSTSSAIVEQWPKFVRRLLNTQQMDFTLELLDMHIEPDRSYSDFIGQLSESERGELVYRALENNRMNLLSILCKNR